MKILAFIVIGLVIFVITGSVLHLKIEDPSAAKVATVVFGVLLVAVLEQIYIMTNEENDGRSKK